MVANGRIASSVCFLRVECECGTCGATRSEVGRWKPSFAPRPRVGPPCKGFERSGSRQRIMHASPSLAICRNQPHATSHHINDEKIGGMACRNKKPRVAKDSMATWLTFSLAETRPTR